MYKHNLSSKKNKVDNKKTIIIGIIAIILIIIFSFIIVKSYLLIDKIVTYKLESSINIKNNFESNKIDELNDDINNLKQMLDLKSIYSSYNGVFASVTSRNRSLYLNSLIIDKGENDGIKKDQAVINESGLIGKIDKVNKYSSRVRLITVNSDKLNILVSLNSNDKDYYGVICGSNDDLIEVCDIDKSSGVKVGDTITTSSLSKVFPSGIYVGKVEKIESDRYGLTDKLYIKSDVNFYNIHYVYVVGK